MDHLKLELSSTHHCKSTRPPKSMPAHDAFQTVGSSGSEERPSPLALALGCAAGGRERAPDGPRVVGVVVAGAVLDLPVQTLDAAAHGVRVVDVDVVVLAAHRLLHKGLVDLHACTQHPTSSDHHHDSDSVLLSPLS